MIGPKYHILKLAATPLSQRATRTPPPHPFSANTDETAAFVSPLVDVFDTSTSVVAFALSIDDCLFV